jgi:arginine-tRNA-protein transferase
MKILTNPKLSPSEKCPYLNDLESIQEYFFALEMNSTELDILINSGWRKFGAYIFRPSCPSCKKCTPLRLPVRDFLPNKKQRKLIRKTEHIKVVIEELNYKSIYFKIFFEHSKARFDQTDKDIGDEDNFKETFFVKTSPSYIFNYYLEEKLIAWGVVDKGEKVLNSVYFAFDPKYSKLELGKLSILKEIEYAQLNGLDFYHLGYYIEGNKSMEYKSSYYPHEQMDWTQGQWNKKIKKKS